ncbi:snoRNP complex protein nop56 [Puccinia graminis f. sp. tritici]|uniref:Nucleolar protein 56 n=1 Tax=Puccinia graminis f. sp. tritici TaxID=56615 RepID=A0A5B0QE92_PUCGR|nr:snoRNP complex protein nop56 [Puccinia graminis f. sp. tritici]
MATHVLFESSAGYALFAVKFTEEIAGRTKAVQEAIPNLSKFGKMIELKSFLPFRDAAHALENANDISEGLMSEHLQSLLELHIPAKKSSIVLGVAERGLAGSIKASLGIECDASDRSLELIRGIRLHAEKLLTGLEKGDMDKSQLGLGHAYSRAKVKFNVNRSDNMIIQAIALLDQLDKDVNTFAMRVREWYGWHFPELVKILPDSHQYASLVKFIGDKSKLTDESLEGITQLVEGNETLAKNILDAARSSMGTDISPVDLINILNFADRVIQLYDYRKSLQAYLREKMDLVAPNLGALIGDTVAARLISHAGSLTNLSKYPASTVQILGAEKALFRALKTKGNTPKYGLIYHSTFIGRAGTKNKGRISRFLANKCSIASRIDCFTDSPSTAFGQALRGQVEERLAFYETGANPTKNKVAMEAVLEKMKAAEEELKSSTTKESAKPKKRKSSALDGTDLADPAEETDKKKKKKKRKSDATEIPEGDVSMDVDTSMIKEKSKSDKEKSKSDKEKSKSDKEKSKSEKEKSKSDKEKSKSDKEKSKSEGKKKKKQSAE